LQLVGRSGQNGRSPLYSSNYSAEANKIKVSAVTHALRTRNLVSLAST